MLGAKASESLAVTRFALEGRELEILRARLVMLLIVATGYV